MFSITTMTTTFARRFLVVLMVSVVALSGLSGVAAATGCVGCAQDQDQETKQHGGQASIGYKNYQDQGQWASQYQTQMQKG
ncbi:hypothetical protein DF186_16090, partial [Enterococcus hirae]